jgi:hypothetical protein
MQEEIEMGKRSVIGLYKNEVAAVSYCLGIEIKSNPDADWIAQVFETAVRPMLKSKDQTHLGKKGKLS